MAAPEAFNAEMLWRQRRAGRPVGKRRRTNLDSLYRRPWRATAAGASTASAAGANAAAGDGDSVIEQLETPVEAALVPNVTKFQLIARSLWLPDYDELFEIEVTENEQLAGATRLQLPPSSYRARLLGEAAQTYDRRRRNQRRDELAISLHSNNQQHWSPSLVARSVAYFGRTSRFLRVNEGRQRRIASKPMVMQALRIMQQCRPQPAWRRGPHIKVFAFDQTYQWVGMKKRGRRQAAEHLDGAGMPMQITHEVYINSINLALPTILGTLSQVRACISTLTLTLCHPCNTYVWHAAPDLHVRARCRLPSIVSRPTMARHTLSRITTSCCHSFHQMWSKAWLTLPVMHVLLLIRYDPHAN